MMVAHNRIFYLTSLLLILTYFSAFAQQEFGANRDSVAAPFDQLALHPPMGWNSWNKFGCNVSEQLILSMAGQLVATGMKDAGYEYVVIDDCWQQGRDKNGNILADSTRFPHGIKYVADYIHSKGLKFGIYSCAGSMTCQGKPGSRGYQFQDARQYAAWGVDYLKYDWCYNEGQDAKSAYKTMGDALRACGRPIVFSICEWGENKPWEWGKGVGHLWRITNDIRDCFDCEFNWGGVGVMQIMDKALEISKYAGPHGWNDLEMLEVGNGNQTDIESRSHFAIWCMLSAPLMAGNDLNKMDKATKAILLNKAAIAINQDSLGKPAFRFVKIDNNIEVLVKPLADGDVAFLFLNRSNARVQFNYNWNFDTVYSESLEKGALYMKKSPRKIIDVWTDKELGTTDRPISRTLEGHESMFLRLKKMS